MAFLTPRRRFFLTAPLALLLPAGLLTYFGLQMVELGVQRYEDRAEELVNGIMHQIRNHSMQKIESLITGDFAPEVEDPLRELLPTDPTQQNCFVTFGGKLDYASRIFVYDNHNNLSYFTPVDRMENGGSKWECVSPPPIALNDSLLSAIQYELDALNSGLTERPFRVEAFPDRQLYVTPEQREIVCFYTPRRTNSVQAEAPPREADNYSILFIGFTFDFNYINNRFFKEIVENDWRDNALRYPISIVDEITRKRVAYIEDPGFDHLKDSTEYLPRTFSDNFPWFKIYYSELTGKDIMDIASVEKLIYYSLIAAANIIMVVGIIGALRNISYELALADMRADFVARVSHELRTPLGLIRLYSETLELGRTHDETKRREYLQAITKESERLTHLISNILNFSQIEAQRKQYKLADTPIETLVEESVDSIRYHLERHGFTVHVDIDPNLPDVPCDRDAMQLALYNLLSNAMKYSGGRKEISIRAYQKDRTVIVDIADRGIGIPKALQKKIFQEFYRVDDPQVRETGGSGLGLAVTQHVIRGHQGEITVQSEPGYGSTFSVVLPVSNPKKKHYSA